MFTGIVERMARVTRIGRSPTAGNTGALRYEIDAGAWLSDAPLGASVAVNGACLTLAARDQSSAAFDVIPETLRLTNLEHLHVGDAVNLERSLRVGDRLDGHFVQGHVDALGSVRFNGNRDGEWRLEVALAAEAMRFVVRKGGIAIDGVSLTVVDAAADWFSVALIPTTLERTTLGIRRAGDRVNIETDILARMLVARLEAYGIGGASAVGGITAAGGITIEQLRAAGFTA